MSACAVIFSIACGSCMRDLTCRLSLAQAMSIGQAAEQGVASGQVQDPDSESCVVCLDEAKSHALVPCGHRCVCGPCSERLAQCPVCRQAVTMSMRVWI